jgi:Spy/CpxP family protein refolding chaperone
MLININVKLTLIKMTKTKALILFVSMFVTFSAANIFSQQDMRKSPEERAQKRADKMKENLLLSDQQHKQVYDILLNHIKEADIIRNSAEVNEDKKVKKEKLKSLRESTHSQLNAILTPEQQQKLDEFIKKMKEKHKTKKNKEKIK